MLHFSSFFIACSLGLRPVEPIPDPEELDVGIPNDSDTDTDTDSDTDTDTDTDMEYIADLISGISPTYGPSTGGTELSINGGPFNTDATVSIGGYPAEILSNNGSTIRVSTPNSNVAADAEVRVNLTDSFGLSPTPFYYFEDGTGLTGSIGEIGIVETVGEYWSGGTSGIQNGFISVAFSNPINSDGEELDFQWWEFMSSTKDSCSNSATYVYSGENIEILDMGTNSIELQGSTLVSLPRGSSNNEEISYYFYQTDGLSLTDITENSFFDLNPMTGPLQGLSVSQFARASKRVVPTSPNIDSSNLPMVSPTQTFIWSPSGASWIHIRMYQLDTNNNIISDIDCIAEDDGQFTTSDVHSTWTQNDVVYIQFSRIYESQSIMPHNNSISRVVGEYIIVGAGVMN